MVRRVKDIARDLRKKLKKQFPKCKFSVTAERANCLKVALMRADFMPFTKEALENNPDKTLYKQLNHFYIMEDNQLTDTAKEVLVKVKEWANEENYDNSDAMTDYFDVGYYFRLDIGKWDKPFELNNRVAGLKSEPVKQEILCGAE